MAPHALTFCSHHQERVHTAAVSICCQPLTLTTLTTYLCLHPPPGRQVLEPRRVAAKSAARRMAALLGEPVGRTVGYRVRLEARVSAATRIEVITEGILLRRLQQDPSLEGVGVLLLDEFHERSLDADTALALALDCQAWTRPDLR